MHHGIKVLYLLLALLIIYTLWPSATNDTDRAFDWGIKVDSNGELQVLGVALNHTSLAQAEEILRTRTQRALFISAREGEAQSANLEAYAASMPDNSRVVLGLNSDETLVERLKQKAHSPIAFPSGNIRMEIAEADNALVETLTVSSLTYIPRIRLNLARLEAQFGTPSKVLAQDKVLHHLYPTIGLDAILDASGEAMLQFVSPKDFQQVLDRLGTDLEPSAPTSDTP